MPFGLTVLVIVSILILFGIGHRVLDRMRLSDKTALLFLAAIFIGTLLPDIPITKRFSINIGGAIVPIILVVYLYVKAGTREEKMRSIWASIISGAAVYVMGKILPSEPETMVFDPNYIYGILAGIIGYLFGRSRRASFIAGVMGVILADIAQGIENAVLNIPTPVRLGAGGAMDAVVISGLLAVILAEFIGEIREKMQGGTKKKDMTFNHGEFMHQEFSEELNQEDEENKKAGEQHEKEE